MASQRQPFTARRKRLRCFGVVIKGKPGAARRKEWRLNGREDSDGPIFLEKNRLKPFSINPKERTILPRNELTGIA